MGEQRRRKERFLREHPYCCFCGGHTLATTEDHQPGRVFFRNREWPEGFVFPACVPCNAASRNSERILGVLIHGHADDDDRSVYQKNLESVRREFPEQIQNLIMTTREARNVFKDRGLKTPRGFTFSEIPLVKIHHEFWIRTSRFSHVSCFWLSIINALQRRSPRKVPFGTTSILTWISTRANFRKKYLRWPSMLLAPFVIRECFMISSQFDGTSLRKARRQFLRRSCIAN